MKVLLVSNNSTEEVLGGTEVYIDLVSGELRKKGIETKTLIFGKLGKCNNNFSKQLFFFESALANGKINFFQKVFGFFRVFFEFSSASKGFDVISLNNFDDGITIAAIFLSSRLFGKKLVWMAHGCSAICARLNPFLNGKQCDFCCEKNCGIKKDLSVWFLKNVDCIVAVSGAVKQLLLVNGFDKKKIKVVYGFEQAKENNLLQDREIVLFAGRLCEDKGINYFIEAAAIVVKRFPKQKFLIVGEPVEEKFVSKVKELGIKKNVSFEGKVNQEKMWNFFSKAIVVVTPSVSFEAMSRVAIEAIVNGSPVIASKIGGFPEIISDGKNGFLVEPANSKQISERIIQILSNPKLAKQLSNNAIASSKKFSPEKHLNSLIEIYSSL